MEDPRLKSRAARISKGSKSSQDQQPQTPQGGSSSHAHQAFTPNQQNLSHAYFPPPPPMTPPTFIPPPLPPGVQLPPDFYQPIRASTDGAISGYAMPPPPQILTPPPTSTWRPHPFLPWAMGIPNQLNFQPRPVGIGDPRLVPRMGMNLCHQSPVFVSHTHLGGVAPIQPLNKPVDPFVESWLKEVAQRRDSQAQNHDKKDSKEQESLKIPDVRSLLLRGVELLSQLSSTHQLLISSMDTTDPEEWETLRRRTEADKAEFLSLRSTLGAPGVRESLTGKMKNLRSKRKRQKERLRERREEWKRRVKGAGKLADEWVKDREHEELKAKMEKSVQASAGGVLGEVKRKTVEIQRLLDLAGAMKELRLLRRESSKKRGDAPPLEADERFRENQEALVSMLSQQLAVYEREEHALRVLMEEEVKEKLYSQQKKASVVAEPEEVFLSSQSWPGGGRLPLPPLLPSPLPGTVENGMESYKQFLLQARVSQEALERIRMEWNSYLSVEGTPLPSSQELAASPSPGSCLGWKQYCLTD